MPSETFMYCEQDMQKFQLKYCLINFSSQQLADIFFVQDWKHERFRRKYKKSLLSLIHSFGLYVSQAWGKRSWEIETAFV